MQLHLKGLVKTSIFNDFVLLQRIKLSNRALIHIKTQLISWLCSFNLEINSSSYTSSGVTGSRNFEILIVEEINFIV